MIPYIWVWTILDWMVKNITPWLMNGLQQLHLDGQVCISSFFSEPPKRKETMDKKGINTLCVALNNYFIDALIQFEDFKYPHAYNLLKKCK